MFAKKVLLLKIMTFIFHADKPAVTLPHLCCLYIHAHAASCPHRVYTETWRKKKKKKESRFQSFFAISPLTIPPPPAPPTPHHPRRSSPARPIAFEVRAAMFIVSTNKRKLRSVCVGSYLPSIVIPTQQSSLPNKAWRIVTESISTVFLSRYDFQLQPRLHA